jgi:hypothetical protein
VLCFALFWVPFFLGMWHLGIAMVRAIQVTQVCRDAAHMWAYGIDFSDTSNQAILTKVAQGLNITSTGSGVIIISTVTYVTATECTQNGLQANTSSCPNMNQDVITYQLVIGNSSIRSSAFGTPASSNGSILPSTYLTDTRCRAVGFGNLMTLSENQYAYMAEMTIQSSDLNSATSSARSIF